MEAERTERRGAIQWVKEHKTVLIAIGVGAIGAFFVAKNWNSIKGLFKASRISSLQPSKKRQQL